MNATTVAVDLAKNVFALAVADGHWKIIELVRQAKLRSVAATAEVTPAQFAELQSGET